MPRPLEEILGEFRAAEGPHIVQGSELRALVAEVDRLRAVADEYRSDLNTLADALGAPPHVCTTEELLPLARRRGAL